MRVQLKKPLSIPFDPQFLKIVYLDGLNKNIFMNTIQDVHAAFAFTSLVLNKELKKSSPIVNVNYIY